MESIPSLHIRISGLTASFRLPLLISGIQISAPVPPYSTLLGLISACAGRLIRPKDTRIGFEFRCKDRDIEIERKDQMGVEKGKLRRIGKQDSPRDFRPHLKINEEGITGFLEEIPQRVSYRQVYWYPQLDLYLTNVNLRSSFEKPATTPTLGRSQDIAWIVFVREIELYPSQKGKIGPTLLPKAQIGVPGLIVRVPEWIENSKAGYVREVGPFGLYQAIDPLTNTRFEVEGEDFYHPSDANNKDDVIYLHRWLKGT